MQKLREISEIIRLGNGIRVVPGPLNLQEAVRSMRLPKKAKDWARLSAVEDCQEAVACARILNRANVYVGDYLADRSLLWRSVRYIRELIEKPRNKGFQAIQLGVDISVAAGTRIVMPFPGRVIYSGCNGDQDGGWGGRVVIDPMSGKYVFVIGHLSGQKRNLRVVTPSRKILSKGSSLGLTGAPDENGGWWSHISLQAVRRDVWVNEGEKLDGYAFIRRASPQDLDKLAHDYPEPLSLIRKLSKNSLNDLVVASGAFKYTLDVTRGH